MTVSRKKYRQMSRAFKPRVSRREFLKQLGGALLASTAITSTAALPSKAFAGIPRHRRINIGTFGPSHCATPFVYAKLQGIYAERGLDVNLTNYSDMLLIAKDLASGTLDFGQLIVPLVFAIHSGKSPIKEKIPLVITQIAGTNGAAITIRKDSGITKPADFKEKTLANHSALSVHYLINMMFLESYGLKHKEDVNIKLIDPGHIIEAMKNGEIDAFTMPEPNVALTEAKGYGSVFLLTKHIWPNHPCCSLVTRREFFEKEKSLVTDVTRAITKSGLAVDNPDTRRETIDILQRSPDYVYDKIPTAVLRKAFTPGRSDFNPFPYQSSAQLLIEIMKRYGLLDNGVDGPTLAREVFQSDLSRQIMVELGAHPPATNYRVEKILGNLKEYSG